MRLIIAHDEEIYREGVKSVLADFEWIAVVGEAGNAVALFELLDLVETDAVLLDLGISTGTCLQVVERVLALAPEVRLVIVAAPDDHTLVRKTIELGADGCLLKSAGSQELATALRMVTDGRHYIQAELVNTLVDPSLESVSRLCDGMSPDQLRILQLVADGLKNKQVAIELGISETTVKSNLRVLYSKLDASSRAHAVAVALRLGIVE